MLTGLGSVNPPPCQRGKRTFSKETANPCFRYEAHNQALLEAPSTRHIQGIFSGYTEEWTEGHHSDSNGMWCDR